MWVYTASELLVHGRGERLLGSQAVLSGPSPPGSVRGRGRGPARLHHAMCPFTQGLLHGSRHRRRRRHVRLRVLIPVIGLLGPLSVLGCEASTSPPPAPQPCNSEPARCSGQNLLECRSGKWEETSCEERCAAQHGVRSSGCRALADAADECGCSVPTRCTDSSRCSSSNAETICNDGSARERSCYESCAGNLPVGCFFDVTTGRGACACAAEGSPCTPQQRELCAGPDELVSCVQGVLRVVKCADRCGADSRSTCEHEPTSDRGRCVCSR
jgi:hypothetical protein